MLVHILGIAEVPLSKAPIPNPARWVLWHVWQPLYSSPLHCMCVFVCVCVGVCVRVPVCYASVRKHFSALMVTTMLLPENNILNTV